MEAVGDEGDSKRPRSVAEQSPLAADPISKRPRLSSHDPVDVPESNSTGFPSGVDSENQLLDVEGQPQDHEQDNIDPSHSNHLAIHTKTSQCRFSESTMPDAGIDGATRNTVIAPAVSGNEATVTEQVMKEVDASPRVSTKRDEGSSKEPFHLDGQIVEVIRISDSPEIGSDFASISQCLLRKFPRMTEREDAADAATRLSESLAKGAPCEVAKISELVTWLKLQHDTLTYYRSDWVTFYGADNARLARSLSDICDRLLFSELTTFGDDWGGQLPRETCLSFFDSFFTFAIRVAETDVVVLESQGTAITEREVNLLSTKPLSTIQKVLSDTSELRSPLWTLLTNLDDVEANRIRAKLAQHFFKQQGLEVLTGLGSVLVERRLCDFAAIPVVFQLLQFCAQLIHNLPVIRESIPHPQKSAHQLNRVFVNLDQQLRENISKEADLIPHDSRSDLVVTARAYLVAVTALEDTLRLAYIETYLTDSDGFPSDLRRELLGLAWNIRLYKAYIAKGYLRLRVATITHLTRCLHEAYKRYERDREPRPQPATVRVAQMLLDEGVFECILGAQSHVEIINISADVFLFLFVAEVFRKSEASLLCKAFARQSDERMARAAFNLCLSVFQTEYFRIQDLILFCEAMLDTELPSLSPELHFLLESFRKRLAKDGWAGECSQVIFQLAIRHLQATTTATSSAALNVRNECFAILQVLSHSISMESRKDLLSKCVEQIKALTDPDGHVSSAILAICTQSPEDLDFVLDQRGLGIALCADICATVINAKDVSTAAPGFRPLEYRLDLLFYIFQTRPDAISATGFDKVWDHIAGELAISNAARDLVWSRLNGLLLSSQPWRRDSGTVVGDSDSAMASESQITSLRSFLELCMTKATCRLQGDQITTKLYGFVKTIAKYRLHMNSFIVQPDSQSLEVSGLDLMWDVMLKAKSDDMSRDAAGFIANAVVNRDVLRQAPGEYSNIQMVAAAIHRALVNKCVSRLTTESTQRNYDDKGLKVNETESHPTPGEVITSRIIDLLTKVMIVIQEQEVFIIPHAPTYKPFRLAPITDAGDWMMIEYHIHSRTGTSEPVSLGVKSYETASELHMHLVHRIGRPHFRVICNGQNLQLLSRPMQSLRDLFQGAPKVSLYIQLQLPNDASPMPIRGSQPAIGHGRTAFEQELLRCFDSFYDIMDRNDLTSRAIFDFLRHLPISRSLQSRLIDGNVTPREAFPTNAPFRSMYALRCLQEYTDSRSGAAIDSDSSALSSHVQLLEAAFSDPNILSGGLSPRIELGLAATMIKVLISLLYARPPSERSPFKNGSSLITRVMEIWACFLRAATEESSSTSSFVTSIWQCLELLFQVAWHSHEAWDTLKASKKLSPLLFDCFQHEDLAPLPVTIADLMVLTSRRLPSSPHLERFDFINFSWSTLLGMSARASKQPRSNPIFYMALQQVMDIRFEKPGSEDPQILSQDSLPTRFSEWTTLLLDKRIMGPSSYLLATDFLLVQISYIVQNALKLLGNSINSQFKSNLRHSIFWKLLFPLEAPEEERDRFPVLPDENRRILFDICLDLTPSDDEESLANLLHDTTKAVLCTRYPYKDWRSERDLILRNSTKYIGMINSGATCFANSLISQLYMTPAFRTFIMSLPCTELTHTTGLVETLQRYFFFMQYGLHRALSGDQLILMVRNIEGEPLSPYIQMDVEEFLNLLLDQTESNIVSYNMKNAFRKLLGGVQVAQIKSRECEHVSEREEAFFTIKCPLEGSQSLEESLTKVVQGEDMIGDNKYRCERCKSLVDANRRTCFKEIPDTVMFHLLRFNYDVFSQRRAKNNDYFSFPRVLDMARYQYEHLSQPDKSSPSDMFELVGVILHTGSAEAGHYISYIRDRPTKPGAEPVWYEFDDDDVKVFDPATIEERCFGGPLSNKSIPSGGVQMKHNCAYMLLYQRSSTLVTAQEPPNIQCSMEMQKALETENNTLLREYYTLSPTQQQFVHGLLRRVQEHQKLLLGLESPLVKPTLDLFWTYVQNYICRLSCNNGGESLFCEMLTALTDFTGDDPALCSMALASMVFQPGTFNACYGWTHSPNITRAFFEHILHVIKQLWLRNYIPFFGFDRNDRPKPPSRRDPPPFFRLLELAQNALLEDQTGLQRLPILIDFLERISALSEGIQWAMIDRRIFITFLRFFLSHVESEYVQRILHIPAALTRKLAKIKSSFGPLIQTFLRLLKHLDLSGEFARDDDKRLKCLSQRTSETIRLLPSRTELKLLGFCDDGSVVWFDRIANFLLWDSLRNDEPTITDLVTELMENGFSHSHTWQQLLQSMVWQIQSEISPSHIRSAAAIIPRIRSDEGKVLLNIVLDTLMECDSSTYMDAFLYFIRDVVSEEIPKQAAKELGRRVKDWAPRLLTNKSAPSRLNRELREAILWLINRDMVPRAILPGFFQTLIEQFNIATTSGATRNQLEELIKVATRIAEVADDDEQSLKSQVLLMKAASDDLPSTEATSPADTSGLEGQYHLFSQTHDEGAGWCDEFARFEGQPLKRPNENRKETLVWLAEAPEQMEVESTERDSPIEQEPTHGHESQEQVDRADDNSSMDTDETFLVEGLHTNVYTTFKEDEEGPFSDGPLEEDDEEGGVPLRVKRPADLCLTLLDVDTFDDNDAASLSSLPDADGDAAAEEV